MRNLYLRLEERLLPRPPFVPDGRHEPKLVVRTALAVLAALLADLANAVVSPLEAVARVAAPTDVVTGLVVALCLLLVRRGRVAAAARLLTIVALLGAVASIVFFGGLDRAVVLAPLSAIIVTVLLVGVRGGNIASVCILGIAAATAWAYSTGELPAVEETDEWGAVFLLAITQSFVLLVLWSYDMARKASAAENSRSAERVTALLEASPDGLLVVTQEGNIERANPAAAELLGTPRAQLKGSRLSSHAAIAALGTLAEGLHELELQVPERRILEANVRRIEGGRTLLFLLRDVTAPRVATERARALEHELAEARRLESLGRLAGGVAHDIRNMLSVVLGNADLLLSLPDLPGEAREAAMGMQEAADRASSVTSQMLAFARRDRGEARVVALDAVLADHERLLRRLVREDLVLSLKPGAPGACVKADPAHLSQVVVNLVANARDATGPGGHVWVETSVAPKLSSGLGSRTEGWVVVEVRDDGAGMDEETRAHAFEPFFTTKAPGLGTGLGLATVRSIVAQLGGQVELSSAPGQGSTFRVFLPREGSPVAIAEPRATTATAGGSATVLVVDDEPLVRAVHARMLAGRYHVLTAAGADEALVLAAATHIDLLVTDMVMPGRSGRALAEALRERDPRLPVLLMSGYTEEVLEGEGALATGVVFLAKPVPPGELRATVDRLLREVRAA